tara:strand:- start:634 stop:837 length:204 start_codon:yes stop_codon:yes gene_type:complete
MGTKEQAMKSVLIALASIGSLLAILVVLALGMNAANDRLQSKCEAAGGIYYRSIEAHRSMCQFPRKA